MVKFHRACRDLDKTFLDHDQGRKSCTHTPQQRKSDAGCGIPETEEMRAAPRARRHMRGFERERID